MTKIDTIIWDLDGTLIDSFAIYSDILAEVLKQHGLPVPSAKMISHNYHGRLNDSINDALGGIEEKQLTQIVKDFVTIQPQYYQVIEHHLFPDALDLAKRAKAADIYQVIVTNREHIDRLEASPRSIVERSSLKPLIDKVICGDDGQHRKPKPEVLDSLTAKRLLAPESTLIIGDQYVDAELARNLNAKAILVDRTGKGVVHIDRLGDDHSSFLTIVKSLADVEVS